MRAKILLFCILILAICFALVYRISSSRPKQELESHLQLPDQIPRFAEANPHTAQPNAAAPNDPSADCQCGDAPIIPGSKTISKEEIPGWEKKFWKIANKPERMQSQEELEELADTIPEDQIQAVLGEFSGDTSSAGLIVEKRLIFRWAQKSPEATAQWAATLPDNTFSHAAFNELATSWAEKNITGAVAWLQQLPEGGNKAAAELAVGTEAASQQQAVTALNLLANVPPSSERDDAIDYAAQQWAVTDADSAVAWIKQLPDAVLREKILGQVAIGIGVQDPISGIRLIATELPQGKIRDNTVITIVRFWAVSAPDEVSAWISRFPNSPLREDLEQNLSEVLQR